MSKDNGGPASDRELLEMAAKAAGIECVTPTMIDHDQWNPLTDDGDALRLAVIVGIDVDHYFDRVETWKAGLHGFIVEAYGDDPCAATRRAIVRAAAAIGSAM